MRDYTKDAAGGQALCSPGYRVPARLVVECQIRIAVLNAAVMSSSHRLMLLELILQGEQPVEQLAEATNLSMANASQHLQRAGLVTTRRDGKRIFYLVGSGPVKKVLDSLQAYLDQTREELRRQAASSNIVTKAGSMSREQLLDRLLVGDVVQLDVRPIREFAEGHLPQAVCIPVAELEARFAELPRDKEIIAYCRG
ncbi:ArsR/SmtB family transcription factor, partial [Nitratireductor aquibiodomus]|uniref:ArsR/SmtB family transcription factor n=1 Tax=Nitratireductor aquibiodomus TaxID=204799 RepID=UPI0006848467